MSLQRCWNLDLCRFQLVWYVSLHFWIWRSSGALRDKLGTKLFLPLYFQMIHWTHSSSISSGYSAWSQTCEWFRDSWSNKLSWTTFCLVLLETSRSLGQWITLGVCRTKIHQCPIQHRQTQKQNSIRLSDKDLGLWCLVCRRFHESCIL